MVLGLGWSEILSYQRVVFCISVSTAPPLCSALAGRPINNDPKYPADPTRSPLFSAPDGVRCHPAAGLKPNLLYEILIFQKPLGYIKVCND